MTTSEENIKDICHDGGVMKEVIKEGEGWEKPTQGCDVTVHYTGTLASDGSKFDSSKDRNEPFKFKLDAGQVIKGWDKCVASMKKGEICKVTLKPEYAYGVAGSAPKIPPNATLVFEIELISFTNEKDLSPDKDGSIMKKILKEGQDYKTPSYETKCNVHVKCEGLVNGENKVFEDTFTSGTTKRLVVGDEEVHEGLEKVLESMKSGERAIARIQSKFAYGTRGNAKLGIPPNTDLTYEVELTSFEKEKESWELEKFADKEAVVNRRKQEGNEFFTKLYWKAALRKYKKALDLFQNESGLTDEEKAKAKQVKLPCHLNAAACYLKENNWKEAISECNKALEIDAKNVKGIMKMTRFADETIGLWRRGCAELELVDWTAAEKDFNEALKIEPDNASVMKSMAHLKKLAAEQEAKDKRRFRGLFQRLSSLEEKERAEEEEAKAKEKAAQEAAAKEKAAQEAASKPAPMAVDKPADGAHSHDTHKAEPMEVDKPAQDAAAAPSPAPDTNKPEPMAVDKH